MSICIFCMHNVTPWLFFCLGFVLLWLFKKIYLFYFMCNVFCLYVCMSGWVFQILDLHTIVKCLVGSGNCTRAFFLIVFISEFLYNYFDFMIFLKESGNIKLGSRVTRRIWGKGNKIKIHIKQILTKIYYAFPKCLLDYWRTVCALLLDK